MVHDIKWIKIYIFVHISQNYGVICYNNVFNSCNTDKTLFIVPYITLQIVFMHAMSSSVLIQSGEKRYLAHTQNHTYTVYTQ